MPPGRALQPALSARRQALQSKIRVLDEKEPGLVDLFRRKHDYLRISLSERCNLRCTYCMPESGVPLLPRERLMTTPEVVRLGRLFVSEGVRKIRLTGGEPTLRRDLPDVVRELSRLGLDSLGMTSNGVALKRKLEGLVDGGLTTLNLSLDTLDEFKYEIMTRRRGFSAVMESLESALALRRSSGLRVKVNCVVIGGMNDMEVPDFVRLAQEKDVVVRFIEYMPFEDNRWSSKKLIPSETLLERIRKDHPDIYKLEDAPSDTTRAWTGLGWKGSIGFISSMSDHFCGTCSRLRLSADGRMKVCLFGEPKLDLLTLLRNGSDDLTLLSEIKKTLYTKKWAHDGLGGSEGIHAHGRSGPMVSIGG